ncbi:MAG: pitrilysin family protein [Kiritimatiellia bacterium]
MKRTALLPVLAGLSFLWGCSAGLPRRSGIAEESLSLIRKTNAELQRFCLTNGMTCLVREDHSAPVVSIQIWAGTGSIHEGRCMGAGMSHAVEHMIFKGTPTRPPGRITEEINNAGGNINAYTTLDRTVFLVDIPSRNWQVGLDVLADAVANASFPKNEWIKERDVILREFAMGKDDPDRVINKLLWRTAYRVHPYRFPVIGREYLFRKISRDDLSSYFARRYVPDRMITSVAGDIDADKIQKALEKAFAGFDRGPGEPAVVPAEPSQVSPRHARRTGSYNVSRLECAWHTVSLDHPDAPALDVLAIAAGRGKSSRLRETLREEQQLVDTINAWSFTPRDAGLFGISASFPPEKEQDVIRALEKETAVWRNSLFSEAEIEKAKRMVLSSELSDLQTMKGQARSYAMGEFYAHDPRFSAAYIDRISSVTPDSVRKAARKYLIPSNRTLVLLAPEEETEEADVKETTISCTDKVEKIELECGFPLLVREDHRLPFVYFCAAVRGGSMAETESDCGISRLTADMLVRGTHSRSRREIAELVDVRGAKLVSFSGYNSFGLKGRCFAADLPLFLELLSDCLLNPAFEPEEFRNQVRLQTSAIDRQSEQPFLMARKALRKLLFSPHPYAWLPVGRKEILHELSVTDIRRHHHRLIRSPNFVLSVFGHVEPAEVKTLVEKSFSGIPRGNAPRISPLPPEPDLPARTKSRLPREQAIVLAGFPGIDVADPRRDALAVLETAMSGLSSDLAVAIRVKEGLAYYAGAYQRPGLDPGLFVLYAGTREETVDRVQDLFAAEIERVTTEGIRQEEFDRAVNRVIADYEMGLQNNLALAMDCALNELYGLGCSYKFSTEERMRALTPEDIKQAASSILAKDRMAVSIVLPERD